MKTCIIQGMHCDACKKIIMMDLTEAGLDMYVENIEVLLEKKGILTFTDLVTDADMERIKSIIRAMNGYSIA